MRRAQTRGVEEREAAERARPKLPRRTCRTHGESLFGQRLTGRRSHPGSIPDFKTAERLRILRESMLAEGWCCHQVDQLSQKYDTETFAHIASLKVSEIRKADHSRCTWFPACVAYNTESGAYETRHTTEYCACAVVQTPYDRLIEVLREGQVPLISIEKRPNLMNDDDFVIDVLPRSVVSKYVAISHVWADGLGNVSTNGLPMCQLKQLRKRVADLQSLLGFDEEVSLLWMDTLCIPNRPSDFALKLVQIDKMSSIYVGAMASLVLDAELMETDIKPRPMDLVRRFSERWWEERYWGETRPKLDLEAYCRLTCSIWMTRTWTLQEGFLPPVVAFQFRNRLFAFGRRSHDDGEFCEKMTTTIAPALRPRLGPSHSEILQVSATKSAPKPHAKSESSNSNCSCPTTALEREFFNTFCSDRRNFASTWNELAGRSTTMPDDVPMIMANMLGLENQALMRCHNTGEMFQIIILSLRAVPISIFFNMGYKQDGLHNRWVPWEIGSHTLWAAPKVSVHVTHFSYEHRTYFSDDDEKQISISLYHTPELVYFENETPLRLHFKKEEEEGTVSAFEARTTDKVVPHELFGGQCGSTYIMIENQAFLHEEGLVRGAVFFDWGATPDMPDSSVSDARRFGKMSHETTSGKQLSFICSLRLRQYTVREYPEPVVDAGPSFDFAAIKRPLNLRIKHSPPPNFSPLRKRPKPASAGRFNRSIIWLGIMAVLTSEVFVMFLGLWVVSIKDMLARGVLLVYPLALIFGSLLSVELFRRIIEPRTQRNLEWKLVKSFEEIAVARRAGAAA